MRDISIELSDIKNFFCKKKKVKGITIKRILGVTLKYVNGEQYRSLVYLLKYILPYYKDDMSATIKDFEKKQKARKISAKEYIKDVELVNAMLAEINPSELPPAHGQLRDFQLNLLNFAKEIMNDICSNTNIPVWLDGGTLLGAVRHGGFIPWDDDLDFATVRKDYEKLVQYLSSKYTCIDTLDWHLDEYEKNIKSTLEKYPDEIFVFRHHNAFKCVKGTINNFYVLDIFAWDYYNDFHNTITLQSYANKIKQKRRCLTTYKEAFEMYQDEINQGINVVQESDVLNPGIDNHGFHCFLIKEIVRKTDIYPLKKIKFEDWEFYAPNNPHNYLKSIYNFYNKLPQNGIEVANHVNTKDREI